MLSSAPWKARGLLLLGGVVGWGLAIRQGTEARSGSLGEWLVLGASIGALTGTLAVIIMRVWLRAADRRKPTQGQARKQAVTLGAAGAGLAAIIGLGSAETIAACLAGLGTASAVLAAGLPSEAFEWKE